MTFQKFQLKWKILKHLASPKQRSAWRKLFSLPPEIFERRFTGIYRHLLSKCSKNAVLERLKMVQRKYLFLTPTIKMFLAVLREYNFYNVECVEVRKMRFFEQNCIVEWVISFASFCWFWDFVTVLGHFNQCNFKIFCRRPTMVSEIFTQPPHHKKAS